MDKLIIKVVGCNPDYKEVPILYHIPPEEIAKEIVKCANAGAAVFHFHEPWKDGKPMGLAGWQAVPKIVREMGCNIVIEHGQGGMPYNIRATNPVRDPKNDLKIEHANGTEMMVNSLGIIDHNRLGPDGLFADETIDHRTVSLTRRELEDNCRYYRDCGVKPRLETFGTPAPFRNLVWLAARKAIDPPYCVTWNFGMEGIVGDPATAQYFDLRVAAIPPSIKADLLPEASCYQPGPASILIHSLAIMHGYHVRVGYEDMPWIWMGEAAKDNIPFIDRTKRLAKEYRRDIATPDEARAMYKIPKAYPGKK